MKKALLTLLCLSAIFITQGQTFCYINDLITTPTPKTSNDTVKLKIVGDYSDPGSYIQTISVQNVGTNVNITIDCAHQPGAWPAVLVPFDTTITLGAYTPGNYHMNLQGTSLGVFVTDTNKFNFLVNLGNPNSLSTLQNDDLSKVYPNPVKDFLNIEFDTGGISISIFDVSGKRVLRKKTNNPKERIDISSLTEGVYLIKCFNRENQLISTNKLFKDR